MVRDFSALTSNVKIKPSEHKGLHVGGAGGLYFVYRWIYGELLLIFVS